MEGRARDQPRLGMEGVGGTTKPGNVLKRANFRVYFVGGMAALGLTWFLTTVEPFASKLNPATTKAADLSRGSKKVPTVPYEKDKDQAHHPEGPDLQISPKSKTPHTGVGLGQSEGRKTGPV